MNFPDFRRGGGDIEVLERNLSERSLEETIGKRLEDEEYLGLFSLLSTEHLYI